MVGQDHFQRRFWVFALINQRATGAGDRSEECVRVIVTQYERRSVVDPTVGDTSERFVAMTLRKAALR